MWDIDADAAHDYAFYFQKQNPDKLVDSYRKKNLGRKMKKSDDKDRWFIDTYMQYISLLLV